LYYIAGVFSLLFFDIHTLVCVFLFLLFEEIVIFFISRICFCFRSQLFLTMLFIS